jgi:peroxiredoxin
MKVLARSPVVIALGLFLYATLPAGAMNLHPGDTVPEFSLPDIDGKTITLSYYRGKTVLLVFWSTWCSRCSEELVFLRDNFGHHEDVPVLLINQDSEKMASRKRIVEMRDRLSLPFPVIMDTDLELWNMFGISALPTSVVIGKDGRIVHAEANFYWETPEKLLKAVSADSSCLRCNEPLIIQYLTD